MGVSVCATYALEDIPLSGLDGSCPDGEYGSNPSLHLPTIEHYCWSMTLGIPRRTYKLIPICIRVCPNKFLDVTARHPFGHHGDLISGNDHPKELQDIRMLDGFPSYHFLPEPLQIDWWIQGAHKDMSTNDGAPSTFPLSREDVAAKF
jgi:hypothetical protein